MKKKYINYIFLLISLLLVFFFNFVSFLAKDTEYSSFENRTMEYLHRPSISNIISGEWFSTFETYCLDQIIGRNQMIQLDFKIKRLLGKKEINDIVLGKDDYLLRYKEDITTAKWNQIDEAGIKQLSYYSALNASIKTYGGHLYYLEIPGKPDLLWDKYPQNYEDGHNYYLKYRSHFNDCFRENDISVIETYPSLLEHANEYLYYRTDHHYTFRGAYYVYRDLLSGIQSDFPDQSFEYPALDSMTSITSNKKFLGSHTHDLGSLDFVYLDHLEYALPSDFPEYTRYESGVLSDMVLVRNEKDYDYTEYGYFMNGDNANTVIKTNRPELPSILIIGYSFTNPLELMAVYNFNEMHSIDPRHFEGSICDYIERTKCDIVVVVDNDIYENNPQDLATLH